MLQIPTSSLVLPVSLLTFQADVLNVPHLEFEVSPTFSLANIITMHIFTKKNLLFKLKCKSCFLWANCYSHT